MIINIHEALRQRDAGQLTYSDIASHFGIPSPDVYKLGQQDLRMKWSRAFDGLSPRIRNSLAAADITLLEELRILHDNLQLLTVPNLGMKSFNEISRWLATLR